MDKSEALSMLQVDGQLYQKQKESAGKFATIAWIGVCLYLLWVTPGAAILSWKGAGLIAIGMFPAAFAFGAGLYLAQRALAKVIMRLVSEPSSGVAGAISVVGIAMYAATVWLVYLCAGFILGLIL